MSAHPNARPACAYIQGHIVNVVSPESPDYNPKYDSIYNHGYGTPAGTLGINCRHVLTPYTSGINTNNQPQYDPKEAIKRGNLHQQQRAYERTIRQAKKKLLAAQYADKKDCGKDREITQWLEFVYSKTGWHISPVSRPKEDYDNEKG